MYALKNFLVGLSGSMNPFGTFPAYRYPRLGDRALDARRLRSDTVVVGRDLKKVVTRALREANGEVNNSPAKE